MIFISHRGNINGKGERENSPEIIDNVISLGYQVEIDIWKIEDSFFTGHDYQEFEIKIDWLKERNNDLWVHCKNVESIEFFNSEKIDLNYFWHEEDLMTLTSKGFMWVYPGKQPLKNSISVMPEIHDDDTSMCIGICSDFIEKYRLDYENRKLFN